MEHISKKTTVHEGHLAPPPWVGEAQGGCDNEQPVVLPVGATKETMYSTVYHGLTVRFGLRPIESLLLATIISLSKKNGYCIAGQAMLASTLGTTEPTINATLKELGQKGLIEKSEKRSHLGTNKIRVSKKVEEHLKYLQEKIAARKKER